MGNAAKDGKEHPCPKGKYGATSGLKSKACDGDCAAGFYCTEGSDQNDENRCGRDQTHPAAWWCPPGVGAPTKVGPNKMTFCCANPNDANCPDANKISCSPDQRHYEGPCPSGFHCENGKPVTIKWRDTGNKGQCFADDISKPNIGQATVNVAEGAIGKIVHLLGQDDASYATMSYGIRAVDGDGADITLSTAYSIQSEACLDPPGPASTSPKNFKVHWDSTTKDAYVVTQAPLTYAGAGACAKHQVIIQAKSGNANGLCTMEISVKNENDAPIWNPATTFELAVAERSIGGTPVKFECKPGELDTAKGECGELGTTAPNLKLEMVSDADAGQDVLFEIQQPTSNGGSYPVYSYKDSKGATQTLKTDEIFGGSK